MHVLLIRFLIIFVRIYFIEKAAMRLRQMNIDGAFSLCLPADMTEMLTAGARYVVAPRCLQNVCRQSVSSQYYM